MSGSDTNDHISNLISSMQDWRGTVQARFDFEIQTWESAYGSGLSRFRTVGAFARFPGGSVYKYWPY